MNKDFMMGAELALRGAGIQDDRMKQQLMAKLTNAQIAKVTQDLSNQQNMQKYAENFLQQKPIGPVAEGASGYMPAGVTPEGMTQQPSMLDPKFLQGLIPFLDPAQAVTAVTSLSGQEYKETPAQRTARELLVEREKNKGKTPNPFELFYNTQKAKGLSDDEIDKLWTDRQLAQVQLRYPPYSRDPDLPPGFYGNRINGQVYGPPRPGETKPTLVDPADLPDLYAGKVELVADKSAMRDLTKREVLLKTFTTRVDEQMPLLKEVISKYELTNPKILNTPINALNEKVIGSGDLAALKLALFSFSSEIGKIESGNFSISELSVSARETMSKIHDPNLSAKELMKVIDISQRFSGTAETAIGKQRQELDNRIKGYTNKYYGDKTSPTPGPGQGATQSAPPISALKEGVDRTFKNGQTWTLKNGQAVRVK